MKSEIEINISVIDDGPVVMRCQGQNTSKGKALRSEEHTSELQSRENLVCRLLLEKKKKKKTQKKKKKKK